MAEPFLGEVRIFAFNYAPNGWLQCNGQLLPISQYAALFSLLGTYFGGDGVRTFALPNLQGAVPIHQGTAPSGTTYYTQGEVGGTAAVTLTNNQTGHSHTPQANTAGTTNSPTGAFPAANGSLVNFATASDGGTMAATMVPSAGGSQSHNNMQPSLVVNMCIAISGIFPSRN